MRVMGEPIQGSDQHSPRIDEELADHPRVLDEMTDAQLWDEPEHDDVVTDSEADQDRTDLRAEIGKYASLTTFPATAADLVGVAVRSDAADEVLDRLQDLDPDQTFAAPSDLWDALGLSPGHRP
jgi:glutamine synthetase adenylyltransferase